MAEVKSYSRANRQKKASRRLRRFSLMGILRSSARSVGNKRQVLLSNRSWFIKKASNSYADFRWWVFCVHQRDLRATRENQLRDSDWYSLQTPIRGLQFLKTQHPSNPHWISATDLPRTAVIHYWPLTLDHWPLTFPIVHSLQYNFRLAAGFKFLSVFTQ